VNKPARSSRLFSISVRRAAARGRTTVIPSRARALPAKPSRASPKGCLRLSRTRPLRTSASAIPRGLSGHPVAGACHQHGSVGRRQPTDGSPPYAAGCELHSGWRATKFALSRSIMTGRRRTSNWGSKRPGLNAGPSRSLGDIPLFKSQKAGHENPSVPCRAGQRLGPADLGPTSQHARFPTTPAAGDGHPEQPLPS
jgi:hypothetical protein